MNPKLLIKYVPNAYTDDEGELTVIKEIQLKPQEGSQGSFGTDDRVQVNIPPNEEVGVVCEITTSGVYFSCRQDSIRLIGLKTLSDFDVGFYTQGGTELFAELVSTPD